MFSGFHRLRVAAGHPRSPAITEDLTGLWAVLGLLPLSVDLIAEVQQNSSYSEAEEPAHSA